MHRQLILFALTLWLSACISSQPLTLDDTFEDDVSATEGEKESVHMGFQSDFTSNKVVFDKYSYFLSKPWKTHNSQSVELRFGKQGTEARFCGAVQDCFEFTFLHIDVRKHPVLCVKMSVVAEGKNAVYDLQVGIKAAKKTLFHPISIYLPQEQRIEEYRFDLRNLLLQHPDFNGKKVSALSFCVHTKDKEPVNGGLLITEISFQKATE